jgi:hypothetical protein
VVASASPKAEVALRYLQVGLVYACNRESEVTHNTHSLLFKNEKKVAYVEPRRERESVCARACVCVGVCVCFECMRVFV